MDLPTQILLAATVTGYEELLSKMMRMMPEETTSLFNICQLPNRLLRFKKTCQYCTV